MNSLTTTDTQPIEPVLARLENTVKALIDLLRAETIAIKAIDMRTFGKLHQSKELLLGAYQSDMQTLLGRKGDLKNLPERAKDSIRRFENDMAAVRVENLSALERAGKSFSRLRDRIVYIARETAIRQSAQYGADGQLQTRPNRAISTGLKDQA
jgi:hypothetical protein